MSGAAAKKRVFSFNRALGGGIGGEFSVLLRHYRDVSVVHSSFDGTAVHLICYHRMHTCGFFYPAVDISHTLLIDHFACFLQEWFDVSSVVALTIFSKVSQASSGRVGAVVDPELAGSGAFFLFLFSFKEPPSGDRGHAIVLVLRALKVIEIWNFRSDVLVAVCACALCFIISDG